MSKTIKHLTMFSFLLVGVVALLIRSNELMIWFGVASVGFSMVIAFIIYVFDTGE